MGGIPGAVPDRNKTRFAWNFWPNPPWPILPGQSAQHWWAHPKRCPVALWQLWMVQVGTGCIGGALCRDYDCLTTLLYTWDQCKIILKANCNGNINLNKIHWGGREGARGFSSSPLRNPQMFQCRCVLCQSRDVTDGYKVNRDSEPAEEETASDWGETMMQEAGGLWALPCPAQCGCGCHMQMPTHPETTISAPPTMGSSNIRMAGGWELLRKPSCVRPAWSSYPI